MITETETKALQLAKKVFEHFTHDKKVDGGRLTFILALGIGQSFVSRDVPEDILRAVLSSWSEAARVMLVAAAREPARRVVLVMPT